MHLCSILHGRLHSDAGDFQVLQAHSGPPRRHCVARLVPRHLETSRCIEWFSESTRLRSKIHQLLNVMLFRAFFNV